MSADVIKQVQATLGVDPDGDWGKLSQAALDAQGGNFKAFAPGCTGAVPHWTPGGGTQYIPCKDEGKTCADKDPCCGALVCKDGACAKPAPKGTSSFWWIVGSLAFAATIVGIAYKAGAIGGPRKNPTSGRASEENVHAKLDELVDRHARSETPVLHVGDKIGWGKHQIVITKVGTHTVQYHTADGWGGSVQIPWIGSDGEQLPSYRRALAESGE